jgi:hypothetical protein
MTSNTICAHAKHFKEFFMKEKCFIGMSLVLLLLLGSCVSITAKEMGGWERANGKIAGKVTTEFTAFRALHFIGDSAIEKKAYQELLKKAQREFGPNADVRNIEIEGGFSGGEIAYLILSNVWMAFPIAFEFHPLTWSAIGGTIGMNLAGHLQKINAVGDVVLYEIKN